MAYTLLSAALTRAKERSGATDADNAYLTELLELSAGKTSADVTHYRPFFVAAKWLEQNRSQQSLKKAKDGIEFTGLATPIASLLALQLSYDQSNDLVVPDGFKAVGLDCVSCGVATPIKANRFNSRSLSAQFYP